MNIHATYGHRVKYTGCDDKQVAWGGCDDPRGRLTVGGTYIVDHTEVHSQHTKVHLVGVGGRFNSVCFEDAPDGEPLRSKGSQIDREIAQQPNDGIEIVMNPTIRMA